MQILDLSNNSELLALLFSILSLLIIFLGLYIYFIKDEDKKILLISLGFLFFSLSGFEASSPGLFSDILVKPWRITMNFIGASIIFLAIGPWKIFRPKEV